VLFAAGDGHVEFIGEGSETHEDSNWEHLGAVTDLVFLFCILNNRNTHSQHKPCYLIIKALILLYLISRKACYYDLCNHQAKCNKNSDNLDACYAIFLQ
jgi:hypothetical protein